MYWDQLTSPQIAALNRSIPVVLLMAATEQHGAHLPLATDRMIGEHFCQELHARLPDEVLILPAMAIGCSEHHMEFAGSLTLQHQSFLQQAEDILDSVYHHGFRNLLILNSHGGNLGIGQVLLERFGFRHRDCSLVIATWWRIVAAELEPLNESGPGGVGHACEFETSLMLHIAPQLVQMDQVVAPQNVATFPWAEADMLRGSRAGLYRSMKTMTPNGVFGDARGASAEKGRSISGLVAEKLGQLVRDMR